MDKFVFYLQLQGEAKVDTAARKGDSFAQADGTRFDLNRLQSPETGRIDIDTTNQNFTVSTSGTFEGGSNKFSLGIPEFVSFVQFDGIPRTLIGTKSPFFLVNLLIRMEKLKQVLHRQEIFLLKLLCQLPNQKIVPRRLILQSTIK